MESTEATGVTLRNIEPTDYPHFLSWYEKDREGIQLLLGSEIESEAAYQAALNWLMQQQTAGQAALQIVEYDGTPIGVVAITEVILEAGRVHIYIDPEHRRRSREVSEVALRTARSMGMQLAVATVDKSNTRAVALARLMGFEEREPTHVTLTKDLRDGTSRDGPVHAAADPRGTGGGS